VLSDFLFSGDQYSRQLELWSLREDVDVELDGDQALLQTPWGWFRLKKLGAMAREALRRMTFGPISLENAVSSRLKEAADSDGLACAVRDELKQLHTLLDRLQHLVVRSLAVEDADQPLLSVVPMTRRAVFRLPMGELPPARLSRFASLRMEGDELVLESPLSLHRVVLHRREAAWVASSLYRPSTSTDLAKHLGIPEALATQVLRYLVGSGMVVLAEHETCDVPPPDFRVDDLPMPVFAEDTDEALATWSNLDLLYHSRSRSGRHDGPFGATYSHAETIPPEPLLKPVPDGACTLLERPSLDDVRAHDISLTQALETRRSIREYADAPTLRQLGELLYRSARVRALLSPPGRQCGPTATSRPYPSPGSTYSLEIYITVRPGGTIREGIHYYDPCRHALVHVGEFGKEAEELLAGAQHGAGLDGPPPLLITMTARFRRMSWKYSGMWYSALLKEVGVLQQTLYLVSTAMGLAPCALGSGDCEVSARAFGLDWRSESSVGEFIVGSRPQRNAVTCDRRVKALGRTHPAVHPVNDPDWAYEISRA
jgi:SagB-type dehydrogenase family enzyme